MKTRKNKDSLENKETLNFLITITETLKSSNALIGRNDEMFALDASKASQLLINKNTDLGRLFLERKLVVDQDDVFGVMSVVKAHFTKKNIIFCDIAESLSQLCHHQDKSYPYHEDVRNWFLSIPQFSESDKCKYEEIYQESKAEINKLMLEHSGELFKAIFEFKN